VDEPARGSVLIKDNMSRDDDAVSEKIETTVPLVIRGVPKEKVTGGSGHEFVGSRGRGVRIVGAAKDTEVRTGRGGAEEGEEGCGMTESLGGEVVQEVVGRVETLSPVTSKE
jgi:hypothetical protein